MRFFTSCASEGRFDPGLAPPARKLVPEDVFRLLTSVSYFSSDMKWQDRRATLFDIAGALTDKEIMASNEQFQALLDSMGKLSLPEYKAKLLSQRKGLTGIRDDTPTRISECQKTLEEIQGIDFVEAREQEQALSDQQTELSRKLIAWENSNVLSDLQLKLREAKLERDTLESQNRVHRQNQSAGKPDTQAMAKTISSERMRLETLKTLTDGVRKEIDSYQKDMGFTKQTREKANNRLILYSIFDVFANHMASMAQYHSMALPVLDALKWFNYRQETPTGEIVGVRDELNRVFGAPEESRPGSGKRGYAENFVIGILKAFNGTEAQGVPSDARGLNALRRFNMAQVAYNFRVVIQQPLAITRAAMILDYGSIVKGMKLKPSQIRENIRQGVNSV